MIQSKITVIGSLNMDLVVITDEHPQIGETVIGKDFKTTCGGKGGNQAVATAKLGNDVQFIGRVGDDSFGDNILSTFEKNGIKMIERQPLENTPTGIACVTVSNNDNSIIIVSGANAEVTPELVETHKERILESDFVMTQLEIPMETINHIAKICAENTIPLLVNPAPAQKLTDTILEACTYITPNEIELEQLKAFHPNLMTEYKHKLIVTCGKDGSFYFDGDKKTVVPGFKTIPVDTTGAGDCFNGAFISAITNGNDLHNSIRFANAAASVAISKFGAQEGMPTEQEVLEKLREVEN
ncbi:ribokinase [Phocicoccus pinnipedialis]|uniref:Ribokinase n=1 Tax=Phocicoccus pinnipedialis TaxID=110845 RepID=A0A6V7RBL9_9BACL|nr:ribokinase [Jeotgalicoccus pinnipedialis]MBP1939886.1 ribokinase [Jeotgalicoccus pinnipedialis]CAD2074722.1 Ribokinase [Jeotgalicoccus pinnipedialis]